MEASEYKRLSVDEFTKAAERYDGDRAGIYQMCRDDYEPMVLEMKKQPFSEVLDVGCGTGIMIEMLLRDVPGCRCTGLDITPRMIEEARKKNLAGAAFVVGDSENLPFADASFDAVMCANSFHHYPDKEKFLREAFRVLRPAGRLILRDYTAGGGLLWLINHVEIPLANLIGHGDVGVLSLKQMEGLCRDIGFQIIALEKQKGFRLHLAALRPAG